MTQSLKGILSNAELKALQQAEKQLEQQLRKLRTGGQRSRTPPSLRRNLSNSKETSNDIHAS